MSSLITLNRSSFGEKDLAISKILENKSGSFSLKPYIFSSSLSLAIDIEVSNLAMLAWYTISFSSSLSSRTNISVRRQLRTLAYAPLRFMRKYVFARGSLNVSSSLYQNLINGSSSIHLG
uniref:Uncharacterized protein n=1 Tax=Opuntia streptacantha TaxID=393608 RepID=A0A7C9EBR1_OPUST